MPSTEEASNFPESRVLGQVQGEITEPEGTALPDPVTRPEAPKASVVPGHLNLQFSSKMKDGERARQHWEV